MLRANAKRVLKCSHLTRCDVCFCFKLFKELRYKIFTKLELPISIKSLGHGIPRIVTFASNDDC